VQDLLIQTARADRRVSTVIKIQPKPQMGSLELNAIPWAQVYIDGRYRGVTPLQGLKLKAGTHEVRLVNPEQNLETRFKAVIRPNRTLSKVIKLR